MLDVFLNIILPIFLVVAVAAGLHAWRRIPVGPISQTTLYVLTPALVFTSILQQRIAAETSLAIAGATVLSMLLILLLARGLAALLGHDRPTKSGFLLATAFPNAGNLALPILQLTFGPEGLDVGVAIFVTQSILTQSVGILVAARSELGVLGALGQVFRMPATYAVLAALAARLVGFVPPPLLMQPLEMLTQAAIPMMLVVLGFQVGAGIALERWRSLAAALAVRLLVSAPLAYAAATLVGLQGVARGALVIVAAMPVAVITTILAQEFRANPKFVTNVVITSTACSLLTLTVVITLVKQTVGL